MSFLLSTIDQIDEYFADCLLMEQEETTDIYNKLGFDFSL
ncbi:hypothetical protein HID58_048755 [Brassica napus]|uniref:Uncharacterized protein n=2 Tax=Brassica napus TaxID=3708 RepID=A0ABQ8B331_BRANA|nr:hypothetical protein HID58_048755 [Brassica napus]